MTSEALCPFAYPCMSGRCSDLLRSITQRDPTTPVVYFKRPTCLQKQIRERVFRIASEKQAIQKSREALDCLYWRSVLSASEAGTSLPRSNWTPSNAIVRGTEPIVRSNVCREVDHLVLVGIEENPGPGLVVFFSDETVVYPCAFIEPFNGITCVVPAPFLVGIESNPGPCKKCGADRCDCSHSARFPKRGKTHRQKKNAKYDEAWLKRVADGDISEQLLNKDFVKETLQVLFDKEADDDAVALDLAAQEKEKEQLESESKRLRAGQVREFTKGFLHFTWQTKEQDPHWSVASFVKSWLRISDLATNRIELLEDVISNDEVDLRPMTMKIVKDCEDPHWKMVRFTKHLGGSEGGYKNFVPLGCGGLITEELICDKTFVVSMAALMEILKPGVLAINDPLRAYQIMERTYADIMALNMHVGIERLGMNATFEVACRYYDAHVQRVKLIANADFPLSQSAYLHTVTERPRCVSLLYPLLSLTSVFLFVFLILFLHHGLLLPYHWVLFGLAFACLTPILLVACVWLLVLKRDLVLGLLLLIKQFFVASFVSYVSGSRRISRPFPRTWICVLTLGFLVLTTVVLGVLNFSTSGTDLVRGSERQSILGASPL